MAESKFTTETTKTENGVELTIRREPNEEPDDTDWGVARQIVKEFGLPPEAERKIRAKIKRLGHYEKLSVYGRYATYFGPDAYGDDHERCVKAFREFNEIKIKTHQEWSQKSDEEIVT